MIFANSQYLHDIDSNMTLKASLIINSITLTGALFFEPNTRNIILFIERDDCPMNIYVNFFLFSSQFYNA